MTKVEAYNRASHPVDVSGGGVVAPGATVLIDDEDAHNAALLADGTLEPLPKAAAPRKPKRGSAATADTTTTEEPTP